jgi:Flp pilus assembly protein CpaB
MSAASLTPARALKQPRQIDARAAIGVLLTLIAVAGSIIFWTASSDTRAVVVANRDLPAGAILGPADLGVTRVRVDDAIYQAAVPASDLRALVGQQLGEPIHIDQVLARAQISSRPRLGPEQVALTIAVSPETAVGGTLRPGDQVEVLATTDKGKPTAKTTVVLPRATVYDVGHAETVGAVNVSMTGSASPPSSIRSVTLIVGQDQALQLAQAKWAGDIDVALLPPLPGSENGPSRGSPPQP